MINIVTSRNSHWMKASLFVAGMYSLIWGIIAIFYPKFWLETSQENFIQVFQVLGIFSFSLGLGFLIAYLNPLRHWPIVLIGLVSKLLLISIILYYFYAFHLSSQFLRMSIINDAIWIIPFGMILYNVYVHEYLLDKELIMFSEHDLRKLLIWYETDKGNVPLQLSNKQPIMLVFLRHFGCTFCRGMIQNLKENRAYIESQGIKIILVHQMNVTEAKEFLNKYKMDDLDLISDPELILYKGFNLEKGRFFRIFGWNGIRELFLKGKILKYGIAMFKEEDPFQMPGVFVIHKAKILNQFVHHSASDTVPFKDLVKLKNA